MTKLEQELIEIVKAFIAHAGDFGQYNEAEAETIKKARELLKREEKNA